MRLAGKANRSEGFGREEPSRAEEEHIAVRKQWSMDE